MTVVCMTPAWVSDALVAALERYRGGAHQAPIDICTEQGFSEAVSA